MMIRRESDDGWILIKQTSHAFLSFEIMSLWGNADFERIVPADEVMTAIKEHDCGWEKTDSSADFNSQNGYPRNFMEMSTESQFEIWSECFERHMDEHPYASLLIALHFRELNERTIWKNPGNESAVLFKKKIGKLLREKLGINASERDINGCLPLDIRTNLRLLQVGDIISLSLCHGSKSVTIPDVPVNYLGDTEEVAMVSEDGFNYTIRPNPFFRDVLRFEISGRNLGKRSFEEQSELRETFCAGYDEVLKFSISRVKES